MRFSYDFSQSQRKARVAEGVMDVFSTTLTLMLVMDPLGNITAFMAALAQAPAERRGRVSFCGCHFALGILLAIWAGGSSCMAVFGLSAEALRISGGHVIPDRLAHDISIAGPRTGGTGRKGGTVYRSPNHISDRRAWRHCRNHGPDRLFRALGWLLRLSFSVPRGSPKSCANGD